MAAVKKKRIPEERLPVSAIYKNSSGFMKRIASQQGIALLEREGVTDDGIERVLIDEATVFDCDDGHRRAAAIVLAIQSRDLLCQLLLEERKQTALLERITKVAEHG